MTRDLIDLSTAYLLGWKTIYDCAEWLAGIDWDNPDLDPENLKSASLLELLATEVAEGLRLEDDFRQEASRFVASRTNFLYVRQDPLTESRAANSSNDLTTWPLALTPQAV